MARLKARIDAALASLASPLPSADDAEADLRVNSYGALYVAQTNTTGVQVPATAVEYTILASAARTTLQSVTVTNSAGYRGVIIVIDTTVDPSTASITPSIHGVSTLGSDDYTILTGAAIADVGVIVLQVFPGAVAAANTIAQSWLPPTWKFKMAVADAESITYSVNAILLP